MTVVTIVTSISYKTDEYEGCKNFMVGNAAETTGDRTWPQNPKQTEQTTLTKLQCICIRLMTTVVTQTQQTCTKPLSLSSACLYQTDGPYFATGPHTLPTKLNIHTSHTCITLLYPTNTIKNVYLSIKKWAVPIHCTRLLDTPQMVIFKELG